MSQLNIQISQGSVATDLSSVVFLFEFLPQLFPRGVLVKELLKSIHIRQSYINKKAQLSLTNPRDACEKFARFT